MASLALASLSWAQDSPLAKEGIQAYNDGDHATAITKLEEARQTDPSAAVLATLGYAYLASGQPIKAIDTIELALAATDKPLTESEKKTANEKLDEARKAVTTVTITSSVAGATVAIDGAAHQPLPLTDHRIRAGDHTFRVEAPQHEAVERKISLVGGGRTVLDLNPIAIPPPPPPPAPAPPPPPPPAGEGSTVSTLRTVGIGAAVLGALGAGVGIASLINARALQESTADDLTAHEARFGRDCSQGDYTACYVDLLAINENLERADTVEALGIGMTVGGSVFLIGGVLLYALAPMSGSGHERAEVDCGLYGLAGFGCSGRF